MLLTADIGNTNIVLALLDEKDRVVSQCRVPSGETLPPEAYDDAIRRVLEGQAAPEGAVIVPEGTKEGSVIIDFRDIAEQQPVVRQQCVQPIRGLLAASAPRVGIV